ncbi:hypothetical protein pb186bvf_007931 [Paramecium bursaria]
MFGQKGFRYELYSIGQDSELNILIIDKQHTQPSQINRKENYILYEYDASISVKLETLLDSLPFIALSLKQIVIIIKEICLKLKEFQAQNLVIKYISLKNILIKVDNEFSYFEIKSNIIKVDIIGIEFINNDLLDQFKIFNQTKKLLISILNQYEQKYIKQPSCLPIQKEWQEFYRDLFLNDDFVAYTENYLKKISNYLRNIDYFQSQIMQDFDSFIQNEIKQFEEGLELQPQYLKKLITSLLTNKYYIMLYDSICEYQKSSFSYISYLSQLGNFSLKELLPQISNIFNEILKELKQNYNFDAVFQLEYDNNISLNNHFKSYYNLQNNWFKALKLNNLMPDYLIICAQANYLNNYGQFKQVLDYIQCYPLKDKQVIPIADNPFNTKIFEPYLISKLQDYLSSNIMNLFQQSKNKIIQEIQITQEDPNQ